MRAHIDPPSGALQYITAGVPVRSLGAAAVDGRVQLMPLDESRPDAFSIITQLQVLVDQFGRDPGVRAAAERILTTRINNDVARWVDTLTRWVKVHLTYVMDPDGAEYIQSPLVLLKRIFMGQPAYGDCDDHVLLLGSLLVSVGVPVRVNGVMLPGADHFDHVILQALVNGRWTDIDPVAKGVQPPSYPQRLIA